MQTESTIDWFENVLDIRTQLCPASAALWWPTLPRARSVCMHVCCEHRENSYKIPSKFLRKSEDIPKTCWLLRTFWEHSENILRTFWEHSENIQIRFWENPENPLSSGIAVRWILLFKPRLQYVIQCVSSEDVCVRACVRACESLCMCVCVCMWRVCVCTAPHCFDGRRV